MLWILLTACAGGRFDGDAPLMVARQAPWDALALPDGRTVASDPDGLTVRTDDAVADADRSWDGALRALGFAVEHDASRGSLVTRTYVRGDERWALSVAAVAGRTTVDLRVLPAPAAPP